jgi:hypothetical protein
MKSKPLAFGVLLCSTLAFAVNWVSAGTVTNPNGTKQHIFVETDKIVKQGAIRAFFVKFVNVPRKIEKDEVYVDYVNVQQIDCDAHTDSVTKQSPEWRTGTQEVVIDHKDFTPIPPFHIDEGSVGEGTMKIVCAR